MDEESSLHQTVSLTSGCVVFRMFLYKTERHANKTLHSTNEHGLCRCTEGSILRGLHVRAERAVVCLHGFEEIAKQTRRP